MRIARFFLSAAALAVAVLLYCTSARAVETEIDHLAQILEIEPGSSVADVGAGSGEISIAMAGHVAPGGIVYSTEIDPKLIDKIRSLVQKAGAKNVIVVTAKQHDTGLPPNSCDAIFLREVYHHLTDPLGIDRSLFRSMRPGARLAIIDFEPIAGEAPAPGVPASHGKGHGVPEQIVKQEVSTSGLKFLAAMDWPISKQVKHYCVLFVKPSSSPARSDVSP